MTRPEILDIFDANRLVHLKFTKADGTARVMRATRNPTVIPDEFLPKESAALKAESDQTVRCFDVEAEGWRSFRVDSLIKIEPFVD
jgi:hypothetical protein